MDGSLRLYNTEGGDLLHELSGHFDKVVAVVFDPRGRSSRAQEIVCRLLTYSTLHFPHPAAARAGRCAAPPTTEP